MKAASYSPKIYNNSDLILFGKILLVTASVLIITFIIYFVILIPLFPNQQSSDPTNIGFGVSICSFNWMNPRTQNKCTGISSFPMYFAIFIIFFIFSCYYYSRKPSI